MNTKQNRLLKLLQDAETLGTKYVADAVNTLISELTDAEIADVQDVASDLDLLMPSNMTFNYETQTWIIGKRMQERLKIKERN